ncbi:MAG: anthranilate synthase component I [bacterium]
MSAQIISKKSVFHTTPLSIFELLYRDEPYAFLYESLEQSGERGRYSFIGAKPSIIIKAKNYTIEISDRAGKSIKSGNPFGILRSYLNQVRNPLKIAPFSGGAVGYVSYDAIRYLEKIPDKNPDELNIPHIFFMFPDELIVFDHEKKIASIISDNKDAGHISCLCDILNSKMNLKAKVELKNNSIKYTSNFTPMEFCSMVERAKDYIFAGDIFQVVLSHRLRVNIATPALDIYRALRITNPSPYMYYLKFGDTTILGSSPETLIKLRNRTAISRPLAGTRPRGLDKKEDLRLERELLMDEKEVAEHIMLVDLARNDLGRVCEYGSIKVTELLNIERYSKVMHIVSNVVGNLRKDCDGIDLFTATFPAGTVSGAPKIRAMEIIEELEPVKRGLYAGAIGYFDFSGDLDFCIAIRTILLKDGFAYIQGGAGIVADSIPENEYQETINKTKALMQALE